MVFVYFVSFTFGASLIENFFETISFSMLMSIECFMPIFVYCEHNNPLDLINRLFIRHEFKNNLEVKLINISLFK